MQKKFGTKPWPLVPFSSPPHSPLIFVTMLGNVCESEFVNKKFSICNFWENQVFAKLNAGICESWLKQINALASISTLQLIYL